MFGVGGSVVLVSVQIEVSWAVKPGAQRSSLEIYKFGSPQRIDGVKATGTDKIAWHTVGSQ